MLGTMMIPATVTLIPQYLLWFQLKMINTYVPLTIGSWLGGGAFMVFMLRQFLLSIPRDLDEAATIDGANPFQILWRVLVPLMKPALTTVASPCSMQRSKVCSDQGGLLKGLPNPAGNC